MPESVLLSNLYLPVESLVHHSNYPTVLLRFVFSWFLVLRFYTDLVFLDSPLYLLVSLSRLVNGVVVYFTHNKVLHRTDW